MSNYFEEEVIESCGSKDCPHMSMQGCMLPYGCIWYSDEENEQERIQYEQKSNFF
jgi:hypothetical protein